MKKRKLPTAQSLHFDIDPYINRFVHPSILHRLPEPLSRFLGYRKAPAQEVGNVLVWAWSFVGTFCGISLVAGVLKASPALQAYNPPVIFASLGATAILDYHTIQSPLAQPRSSLFGHALAAIVGVAVTKAFMLSAEFEELRWLAGAVSCGAASVVMGVTNSVHPPGGATALIAAIDPTVTALGWMFVPLVLLGSMLMLLCALVVNNIQRQFPSFWWTPQDVGERSRGEKDIEIGGSSVGDKTLESASSLERQLAGQQSLTITSEHVIIPEGFGLGPEEVQIMDILRDRLRLHVEARTQPGSASLSTNSAS